MKTIERWAGAFLAIFLLSTSMEAATILTGESVRITTPIEGNVYAGAGSITVDALVNGDVTAGAGEMRVLDTIRRDLTVGGGRVWIDGVIGEDLRCGGGEVNLFGQVLGDVVIGSGQLEIGREAVIHGDLVVGGGRVRVYGRVMGSVILAGGEIVFEGIAEQDAEIRGGDVMLNGIFRGPCKFAAPALDLGDRAEFHSDLRYWRDKGELDFSKALRDNARAVFDPSLRQDMKSADRHWITPGFSTFFLFRLLAGALLITVLLLLFEPFFKRSGEGLPAQWLNRFGTGTLYLIGLPVLVILLFITVIGIPFGLFALFFYLFSLLFAHTLTAVVGACALERYQGYSWTKGQRILAAIGILLGLKLIAWAPFVGFLASLIIVSIAFGSIVKTMAERPAAMGREG